MLTRVTMFLFMVFIWSDLVAPKPVVASPQSDIRLAREAQALLKTRCYVCHGQGGRADKDLFVLDRDRLVKSGKLIPGDLNSLLFQRVEKSEMPPPPNRPLAKSEIEKLRKWIKAGAPGETTVKANLESHTFVTESEILQLIKTDVMKADARTRSYLRYFSLTHLSNAGVPEVELETYRAGLSRLLNSLSWRRKITLPEPIDPAHTIFRIDLRDYQWTDITWAEIVAAYPYFVKSSTWTWPWPPDENLPYIRADWFARFAASPPLYHNILELPPTLQGLEKMLGVDVAANLREEKYVLRGGVLNSEVSSNNRVLERHPTAFGAYWRTYDCNSSIGAQSIVKDPLGFTYAGGEIIFNLPNGFQGYYLTNAQGKRLDVAPIEIVSDHTRNADVSIHNGLSCMGCHDKGMRTFEDKIRPSLLAQVASAFDRQKALALYSPQETITQALVTDAQHFQKAAQEAGGKDLREEPITALAHRFVADLNLAQAAAEAGMKPDEFQEAIRLNPALQQMGFQQFLVENGTMKRDTWDACFRAMTDEIEPSILHFLKGSEHYRNKLYDEAILEFRKSFKSLSGDHRKALRAELNIAIMAAELADNNLASKADELLAIVDQNKADVTRKELFIAAQNLRENRAIAEGHKHETEHQYEQAIRFYYQALHENPGSVDSDAGRPNLLRVLKTRRDALFP